MGTLSLVWGIIFIVVGLYFLAVPIVLGSLFVFLGYSEIGSFILGIILISIGRTLIRKYDSDKKKLQKGFKILGKPIIRVRKIEVE